MIEWVLDTHFAHLHVAARERERSVIVFGAMEAALTPLMEAVEARFSGVKVFSLPSVDHPEYGRHIELGVKGDSESLASAYAELVEGLKAQGAKLGPELGALSHRMAPRWCFWAPRVGAVEVAPTGMLSANFSCAVLGLEVELPEPARTPRTRARLENY